MESVYLTTAYFPPIAFFSKLLMYKEIYIELHENFCKQSYRNRCNIITANGLSRLTLPVIKSNSGLPIGLVQPDYSTPWQKQHRRALATAYNSSPFYEFYIDDFSFVFDKKHKRLWDLNKRIIQVCCELLQINPIIRYTECYKSIVANDFRSKIHPKYTDVQLDNSFTPIPYTQVFSSKYNFEPNLSIIDLLFNLGPESETYLLKCIGK